MFVAFHLGNKNLQFNEQFVMIFGKLNKKVGKKSQKENARLKYEIESVRSTNWNNA